MGDERVPEAGCRVLHIHDEATEQRIHRFVTKHTLSTREAQVLRLLIGGVEPKAMESSLGCRYASIRTHLWRMYKKLGCSGTRELILRFFTS